MLDRITVDFVLKLLGDPYTADDIVREYPELHKDDVFQSAKCRISVSARRLPNRCYE